MCSVGEAPGTCLGIPGIDEEKSITHSVVSRGESNHAVEKRSEQSCAKSYHAVEKRHK